MSSTPDDRSRRRPRLAGLGFSVAIGGLIILLGAIALAMPLLGQIGLVVFAGPVLFGMIAGLHYLVWGRWLTKRLHDDSPNS